MFKRTVLEEEILPQLLLGIRDDSDQIVAATLKALADLVPLLGADTVVGAKYRRKVFRDGTPGEVSVTAKMAVCHIRQHYSRAICVIIVSYTCVPILVSQASH